MARHRHRGLFLWHELRTARPREAADFFRRILGWEMRRWEGSDRPYWTFRADGRSAGGLTSPVSDEDRAPRWLGYVGTPDADADAERAVALGAREVVPPSDLPPVARFAILEDPFGGRFAVCTPRNGAPDGRRVRVGTFTWHELVAPDPDAALEFYGELFGWEDAGAYEMEGGARLRTFERDGVGLGGVRPAGPDDPERAAWLHHVRVVDLDGVLVRVEEEGGSVTVAGTEVPGGDRVARCRDPRGAPFALHEVETARSPGDAQA